MVCCSGTGAANTLRDAQGNPLHAGQFLTDEQLLNSPNLKEIRLAMLRGEWPAVCERCRLSEEAVAVSIRRHMNERFGKRMGEALSWTREDGTLDRPEVRYADIRLGNVCNLTCRMCGPWASRLWADLHNEVRPACDRLPIAHLAEFKYQNWVKRQPVQWLIEQCLPTVESLHFAGGEPLIIPEMVEALETCVQSGRADRIDLSFNTNITVLPEKVTRLWPHFRTISLLCSVDGFGKLNEYIRRPSKWKDIDRNLHLLDERFEEWHLCSVICSVTVQIYNVLQLGELYGYLSTSFRRVSPIPQLTPLYYPSYLSAQILPEKVRNLAKERLLAERSKEDARQKPMFRHLLSSIDTIAAFLTEPSPPQHIMDFLYFTEKSDRLFGDSWRGACPELAQLLGRQAP
jgi:sulfatase maturation enzyme AslB (radical SAM superfamily)